MRYKILIITVILNSLFAGEFDLFEKNVNDPSVYGELRKTKLRFSYSLFPAEQKKANISLNMYFNKKAGILLEYSQSEFGSEFKEKTEISAAFNYRFTKRMSSWVFFGDLGISANDDIKDDSGVSKGFRLNHVIGRFSVEYSWDSGFGLDFSMTGRMPIEFDLDEDVSPIHSLGLIYQF